MKKYHRILHMSSFSRSGETVLLRCLDAHPQIHVVHQIREPDKQCDLDLFHYLMNYKPTEIDASNSFIKAANVPEDAVIILKNAVWTHQFDFNGFILIRNPFAVVQSFKITNETPEKKQLRRQQIRRWTNGIDKALLPAVKKTDHLEMICMLYLSKMSKVLKTNLPILRYEDFTQNPSQTLRLLLQKLDIPWDESVTKSHEIYQENTYGHGHIKLWEPIHTNSLESWKEKLPPHVIARVYGMTSHLIREYGYEFIDNSIELRNVNPNLITY